MIYTRNNSGQWESYGHPSIPPTQPQYAGLGWSTLGTSQLGG